MTVLRRFDCVLAPTKARVLAEHAKRKGSKLEGDALDTKLNQAAASASTTTHRSTSRS
jgi:type I restriction enzyme M protein